MVRLWAAWFGAQLQAAVCFRMCSRFSPEKKGFVFINSRAHKYKRNIWDWAQCSCMTATQIRIIVYFRKAALLYAFQSFSCELCSFKTSSCCLLWRLSWCGSWKTFIYKPCLSRLLLCLGCEPTSTLPIISDTWADVKDQNDSGEPARRHQWWEGI